MYQTNEIRYPTNSQVRLIYNLTLKIHTTHEKKSKEGDTVGNIEMKSREFHSKFANSCVSHKHTLLNRTRVTVIHLPVIPSSHHNTCAHTHCFDGFHMLAINI